MSFKERIYKIKALVFVEKPYFKLSRFLKSLNRENYKFRIVETLSSMYKKLNAT